MSQNTYPSTSYLPNTINLNIIEPRKIIEPVNYYEQFNKITTELNSIYESREAQKRALEKLTNDALINVDALQVFGYSTSFNNVVLNLNSSTKSNINKFYSELINGQIDPVDYPHLINLEVNNYYSTLKSLSIVNTKISEVINNLKNQNKLELIEMVSQIIDNVSTNSKVSSVHSKIDKNKRYYMFTDLKTIYISYNRTLTGSDFNSNFISPLEKFELLSFGPKEEQFKNQVLFDKTLLQSISLGKFSLSMPFSFSKFTEFNKNIQSDYFYYQRDYANLSQIKFLVYINKVPANYNHDAKLVIEKIKKLNNSRKLYFGLSTNKTNLGVVSDVTPNSPAFQAGIKIGDRIESINGIEFKSDSLIDQIKEIKSLGDSVSITLYSGEKKVNKTLIIGIQPNYINAFEFDYNNQKGVLNCWESSKEDFGETVKSIFCKVYIPFSTDHIISMDFDIKLPNDNTNISSTDYFNIFKPVLKEIINSVKPTE
jgi:hypothetical protein